MNNLNSLFIFILIIFLSIYSSFNLYYTNLESLANSSQETIQNEINIHQSFISNISDNFFWPIPGFNKISSYFGKRTSPTTGASSYHSGIDIPASNGSNLYSVLSGTVSYIGFKGANGYTIIISSGNYEIIYGHVSPNYIIQKNQNISKGEVIGFVGPKYVYDIINNPYKDSKGIPTNGATTGSHLHLSIKKDGKAVNPLNYFSFN